MFAVTKEHQRLSPLVMQFGHLWIYDLKSLHPALIQKISAHANYFVSPTLWEAVLKAEDLHRFTPTQKLLSFADEYHSFFKTKISKKNIRDVFASLRRLGLHHLGDLRKLPLPEIQNRFGKPWKDFFHGLIKPETAPWSWKPYREKEVLEFTHEFENLCADFEQLFQPVKNYLENLSAKDPNLQIQKLILQFITYESTDDPFLEIAHPYPYLLKRDCEWILKILSERMVHLSFRSAISQVKLSVHLTDRAHSVQLSLFSTELVTSLEWKTLCEKLLNEQFDIFVPEILPSYLPETSWKKASPFQTSTAPAYGLLRPLIQEDPKVFDPKDFPLWFTERLSWFDESGEAHKRDYFITRTQKEWIWIFQDEKDRWFRQGVLE